MKPGISLAKKAIKRVSSFQTLSEWLLYATPKTNAAQEGIAGSRPIRKTEIQPRRKRRDTKEKIRFYGGHGDSNTKEDERRRRKLSGTIGAGARTDLAAQLRHPAQAHAWDVESMYER
jgi:hypothetical protein